MGTIGTIVANGDETTSLDLAVGGIAGGAGGLTNDASLNFIFAIIPNFTGGIEERLQEISNESISNDSVGNNENINVSN